MIGLLAQGPRGPVAPTEDMWAHGADALATNGAMWASLPGEWGGQNGLGLTGIGEGGGGLGEGIGLGTIGALGHTDGPAGPGTGGSGSKLELRGGRGRGSGGTRTRASGPTRRQPPCRRRHVSGGAATTARSPAVSRPRRSSGSCGRTSAASALATRTACAENPNLQGRVRCGSSSAGRRGVERPTAARTARLRTSCVVRAFSGLSFPQPEGGIVTVSYPIVFSPE